MTKPKVPARPVLIGTVALKNPLILAPMAGYSDGAQRALCHRHGAALCYTEMMSARGMIHNNGKTHRMLHIAEDEGPVVAHLYGSDPDVLAHATAIVSKTQRFVAIDLNCGCPVRKIVSKGAGAALMRSPERIGEIVTAMRRETDLPVLVKTRIGPSPEQANARALAQASEAAGAEAIAIHARFASMRHRGLPDLEQLKAAKDSVSIPVIGNGGIQTINDLTAMRAATGVDAFMIARGAIGDPWIFERINRAMRGVPPRTVPIEERREHLFEHIERIRRLKEAERKHHRSPGKITTEVSTIRHFRAHLFPYLSGFRGALELRRDLQSLNTFEDLKRAVEKVLTPEKARRER